MTVGEGMMPFEKVDRVEIIDSDGRAFTRYGVSDVSLSLQDGGHTLKVFLSSRWRLDRAGGVLPNES
jgi:hypothetical protein